MASSDNLASLEQWSFRSSFPESWISEAYSRDTETLTRALQKSLSSNSNTTETFPTDTDNNNNNSYSTFQQQFYVKNEQLFTTTGGSVSDPDTIMVPKQQKQQQRRNNAAIITSTNGGRIAKRKSRASKRSPTTFIAADPSNFRQMVQQVTGIRFGDAANMQQFTTSVLKPAPQRPGNRIPTYALPTLDTSSAFLLDNNHPTTPPATTTSQEQPVEGGGTGLDFATFHNFPTLESWRVM